MAQGIPILKDAPYNVLTVPNYVRGLVVTTKPAQVIAAYTAPPGVEAWTVYRPSAEGVPAHPYDGWRVVTPLSEDAETTVAATLTEHIVNDTEYVVRVFIRGRLGFQTRVVGAVATATPVAGIPLGEWELGSMIDVSRGGATCLWRKVSNSYNGNVEIIPLWLETITESRAAKYNSISTSNGVNTSAWEQSDNRTYLNGDFYNAFDRKDLIVSTRVPSTSFYGTGGTNNDASKRQIVYTDDFVFLPSPTEIDGSTPNYGKTEGAQFAFLTNTQRRPPGGARKYRLRPRYPYGPSSYYGIVDASGTVSGNGSGKTLGIRPVICLSASTLISPEPNADGSYSPIL